MDPNQQQLLLGYGGASDATYIDEVFSTQVYPGTGAHQVISPGIKLGNSNAGKSVEFDGNGDYLQIPYTSELGLGSGDFTIECWAYHKAHFSNWAALFGNWGGAYNFGYVLETVGSGATADLEFYYYDDSNTSVGPVQGGSVACNQWNHLCVCRSGNTIRVFVNGTMYGSGTSITTGIRNGTAEFTVGGRVAGAGWWDGFITDLRVTKGQALYTANFTPSTAALTTTSQGATASNVKLLCCNQSTITGATVTPETIIRGPNYQNKGGNPSSSTFGRFTAIDGEGGLVWLKRRTGGNESHYFFDTERPKDGANYTSLASNTSNQWQNRPWNIDLNNSGWSFGPESDGGINATNSLYVNWLFRKAPGFFDIVTYTGNGSNRTIPHNLGSVPGAIFIKQTNGSENWRVYHTSLTATQHFLLNQPNNASNSTAQFNDTNPTDEVFTVGTDDAVNQPSKEYVAYIFGGGSSTDSSKPGTARSVKFNTSNGQTDYLNAYHATDFALGTGDFTIECYARFNNTDNEGVFQLSTDSSGLSQYTSQTLAVSHNGSVWHCYGGGSGSQNSNPVNRRTNHWYHLAYVRKGNTTKLYVDGKQEVSFTDNENYNHTNIAIGGYYATNYLLDGNISNFRVIKGKALYSGSPSGSLLNCLPSPPADPLPKTSETKILCCNNASTTGGTLIPGTLTAVGSPTASKDSPFPDQQGYIFGENNDKDVIKCGGYVGNTSKMPEINLGWEPQFIIIKSAGTSDNWAMFDNVRGMNMPLEENYLYPNLVNAEYTAERLELKPDGFRIDINAGTLINDDNTNYTYIAIRRSDGLVGKPAAGPIDVFDMDFGINSQADTGIPSFDSSFTVDYRLHKIFAGSNSWYSGARTRDHRQMHTNTSASEVTGTYTDFEFSTGEGNNWDSTYMAWMWKRHTGFDVVNYWGNGFDNVTLNHHLGRSPEMIWIKNATSGYDWMVWHKDLSAGNHLILNSDGPQTTSNTPGLGTVSATDFNIGSYAAVNAQNNEFMALLFASVAGISKLGYWDGDNTSDGSKVITTGFRPRFILFKCKSGSSSEPWIVLDSLRGMGAGNDKKLILNGANAQVNEELVDISATGFSLKGASGHVNASNHSYIYYAHA